jgi:uncharacterized protein
MRVKIEEIQEKGLELKAPIAPAVLVDALADSEGFSFVAVSTLAAKFERVSGRVHLRGAFTVTLKAPCRRCVADVTQDVPVEFSLRMIPKSEVLPADADAEQGARSGRRHRNEDDGHAPSAGSFEVDQVDAELFDGKTIDLDPIVREQVLLALPVSVVCRDDCKGLCTVCGQDLNEQDCGHSSRRDVDVRLAKLKDIRLKQ